MRMKVLMTALVVGALALPAPVAALGDREEKALGALIGVLAGAAIAKKMQEHRSNRYLNRGDGYVEPVAGVICYDRDRTCYRDGRYSARWTHDIYGY